MNKTPFVNFDHDSEELDYVAEDIEPTTQSLSLIVADAYAGTRLDASLAKMLPDYSRSRLSEWIKNGLVTVNQATASPKTKLIGGEVLHIIIKEEKENLAFEPEALPLSVIYEDEEILVINKPANLVVHPAAGNWSGTLLNALLYHYPELQYVPRAGIVHRLDKDTTGLMVVARTIAAQNHLVAQLQNRTVKRIYRAIADGIVPFDGKIETLIGRDPHNRIKMAVVPFGGKTAITHVRVLERYLSHSYIECSLETGRTHQIRVHMREAKHPLLGDPVYGNPRHPASKNVKEAIKSFPRQALHAYRLQLIHPKTGEDVSFSTPMPEDMKSILTLMRSEAFPDRIPMGEMAQMDQEWDDDDGVCVIYTHES